MGGHKIQPSTLKRILCELKLNRDWPFSALLTENPAGLWLSTFPPNEVESNSVPAEDLLRLVKWRKRLWVSTAPSKSLLQTCQLLSKHGLKWLLYFQISLPWFGLGSHAAVPKIRARTGSLAYSFRAEIRPCRGSLVFY